MNIRIVYMIIQSIKLVHKANVFATEKHQIYPTLEGGMPIGSFGTPKTFRVPQNTTCQLCWFFSRLWYMHRRSLFSRFTAKLLSWQVLILYPIGCNDDSTTANYTRRGIKSVRKNSHAEYCYAELGASCLCPNPILNSDGDTRKFFWVKNYRRELFARKPVGLNL